MQPTSEDPASRGSLSDLYSIEGTLPRPSSRKPSTYWYWNLLYAALLVAVVVLLFLTGAPVDDAFSYPDAPRHALNGAFMLDLIRDHPFANPTAYSMNYYIKYPALTILFYPPLFYVLLAAFYAVFGVSQSAALGAMFVCYVALAIGCFRLARFWLSPLEAFGVALILAGAPEIAYWGRQVMLEIPAFALIVWSAVFVVRYLHEKRITSLYLGIALTVLAMYVKLTSGFFLIVCAAVLFETRGKALLRDRHSYIIALLAVIAIIPLLILTLKFGQTNIQSVRGSADGDVTGTSISEWVWYAKQLPTQIGWPCLAATAVGLGLIMARRNSVSQYTILLLWFAIGYLFFSAISLKDTRFDVAVLFPIAMFAAIGMRELLARWPRTAGPAIVVLGIVTFGLTYFGRPVQYVSGYREVTDYIAKTAPRNSVLVFSGYRDGSFIFSMRTHEERRDLWIIRSDKLLLKIAVSRSQGVQQKLMSADAIAKMLDDLGVRYVIAQPGFWTDLEAMRRFEEVLHSPHFELVRSFSMRANYHAQENEIVVYRNLGHIASRPADLKIDIPMINRTMSSVVNKN